MATINIYLPIEADRKLKRLAKENGYKSVSAFCRDKLLNDSNTELEPLDKLDVLERLNEMENSMVKAVNQNALSIDNLIKLLTEELTNKTEEQTDDLSEWVEKSKQERTKTEPQENFSYTKQRAMQSEIDNLKKHLGFYQKFYDEVKKMMKNTTWGNENTGDKFVKVGDIEQMEKVYQNQYYPKGR